MCVIAYQPAGLPVLSKKILENCWNGNSHGAGYMFAADGVLTIRKPFFKLKDLKKAYMADHKQFGQSSPFVLHFRYATHGERTYENTHPHSLDDGAAGLAHNGILSDFLPPLKADYSDTVHFCRSVLVARDKSQLVSDELRKVLGELIGKWNKFVILTEDGEVSIVNEDSGEWSNGVWYSNDGYLSWSRRSYSLSSPSSLWRDWEEAEEEKGKFLAGETIGNDSTAIIKIPNSSSRTSPRKRVEDDIYEQYERGELTEDEMWELLELEDQERRAADVIAELHRKEMEETLDNRLAVS